MGIRIGSAVVNCADLETMTEFWTQALGLTPSSREPGDDFRVLRGERVNMSLQVADTPVTARDQMHLDLYSDDPQAQVARLIVLGARYVREHVRDGYVVLLDPEGNEFCVCTVDPESLEALGDGDTIRRVREADDAIARGDVVRGVDAVRALRPHQT